MGGLYPVTSIVVGEIFFFGGPMVAPPWPTISLEGLIFHALNPFEFET